MFVVSYMGILHGPFSNAEDAAKFGISEVKDGAAPWTIIPLKKTQSEIVFEALGKRSARQVMRGRHD